MLTDYSKLSMTKLVNVYQNFLADASRLSIVLQYADCDSSVYKMHNITLLELNAVLTEIIKRLNLKGEQENG